VLYHHLKGIGAAVKTRALQVDRRILSAVWFGKNYCLWFVEEHILYHMSNILCDLFLRNSVKFSVSFI
jgi:hypothetical protein